MSTRSQAQKMAWSVSELMARAVTQIGFSTYSEMRSANCPARDTFLSGVMERSAHPNFSLDIGKPPYFISVFRGSTVWALPREIILQRAC